MVKMQVATVRAQALLSLFTDFENFRRLVQDCRLLLLACALALGACGRDEAPRVAAEPRVVAARGDVAADEAAAEVSPTLKSAG